MTKRGEVINLLPGDGTDDDDSGWLPNWDEWMVPARDAQGHYVKVQIKMPRQLMAEAHRVIDSGVTPFKSIGYLYRCALLGYLLKLREHPEYGQAVGSTIHAVNASVKIIRDDEYMENFRLVIDSLSERVRDYENRGCMDKARTLIMSVWAQMQQIEDVFWQNEYIGEMKRRFGRFLEQKGQE
jgi:hypothetical protein